MFSLHSLSQTTPLKTKRLSQIKGYPWLIILFCSFFLMYKYILQVYPSIMTDDLMRNFHINGAGLGNLAAMFFYTYVITQLFVGPLFDKFSPRLLTSLAIAFCAIGVLIFGQANSLIKAEVGRAIIGIGVAFATVSYLKMTTLWFRPQQFAFVSGLLATAAMLGALFGEAPLALLVKHVGWRDSLYYCALLGFAIALLFWLLVRDRKKPIGLPKSTHFTPIKMKDVFEILKQRKNWYLTFYSGLAFSPVAVFGGLWGNPFLQEAYHLQPTQAANYVSFVFIGLALGGPLLGLISDKLRKRFHVMFCGTFISLIAVTCALYFTHQPLFSLAIMLFLFGFGTGAFMLGFAMGKELNKISLAATVIALINTGDAIFGAFTEPLIGKMLDNLWAGKITNGAHHFSAHSYHIALGLIPLYLLAALVFLWLLRKQKPIKISVKERSEIKENSKAKVEMT